MSFRLPFRRNRGYKNKPKTDYLELVSKKLGYTTKYRFVYHLFLDWSFVIAILMLAPILQDNCACVSGLSYGEYQYCSQYLNFTRRNLSFIDMNFTLTNITITPSTPSLEHQDQSPLKLG